MKCLLIETKDKRKFFTHKKNLMQLREFSKTFDSNIYFVDLKNGKILELDDLAKAICNSEYFVGDYDYNIINNIKSEDKTKTKSKNLGIKIQDFIKKELIEKRPISIKKIKSKFKKHSISEATLYNKMKKVKNDLEKKGYKFLKIKTGVYRTK